MKKKIVLCLVIGVLLSSISSYATTEDQTVNSIEEINGTPEEDVSKIVSDEPVIEEPVKEDLLLETPILNKTVIIDDASDPNYNYALELEKLNVFKGTGAGFELNRQPTRIEGAVMFVRLLGKEEEALAKQYPHPFIDVPEWANPYVGYLYEAGLTKGIGDNEYGSGDILNRKSYLTFVMRCLGYSDEKDDFEWDTVEEKAKEIKVVDEKMVDTDIFNRSELAKVSVTALNTQLKDSDLKLIDTIKVPDTYDFYVAVPINMTEDNWLTNFAGGREKEIAIQIGKIIRTNSDFQEVYIDLIVNDQVITLAQNGGHFEYYEGTSQLKKAYINFFTGKKFDGKEVVKDYSEGFIRIDMIIEYDEMGNGTPCVLFHSIPGNYLMDYPKDNYYQLFLIQ